MVVNFRQGEKGSSSSGRASKSGTQDGEIQPPDVHIDPHPQDAARQAPGEGGHFSG